jgi:hypothetical protein
MPELLLIIVATTIVTVETKSVPQNLSARASGDYVVGGIFRIHLMADEARTQCYTFLKQGKIIQSHTRCASQYFT